MVTTNIITEDAVAALTDTLDDALTMARVNKTLDETEPIARQCLTVLSQFGWMLVQDIDYREEKPEAKERNIFQAVADQGKRNENEV